ncbi:MAG: penicillin-binding protein 2 [Dehalococcoidia bacterium]|nr:penicillin-binding protein 2 [Dehalococcoidia bacterium]
MRPLVASLIALALLAAACGGGAGPQNSAPPATPEDTAERFLSLWKDQKYSEMYGLISREAQTAIDREKFVQRYEAIADEATLSDIDYELKPRASGEEVAIPFSITFHTRFFGDIKQTNEMAVAREEIAPTATGGGKTHEEWRIAWKPSLIFKELDDRSLVHFFTRVPRRGAIYDRNARPLALDAQLPVVGIVPDLVTDKEAVIARLTPALGMPEATVRAQVETTLPSYYFIPVKTLPYGTPPEEVQKFRDMVELGVLVREETRRLYPNGAAAAHVLGYLTEVTEEQLTELAPKGFEPGDMIGAAGLEGQFDDVLSGERGGMLATVTPEGSIARTIAETKATAGKDLHLTIDIEVQKKAEAELGERIGSVVVMDPRDNAVLALASSPRFDPNSFIQGLSAEQYNALATDPREPFLHRPLLATYPPGSTFKTVTMAAGLERGGFSEGSTIHCSPVWTGLGEEFKKENWQKVDRGFLTPPEGLMASCNPVFYEIAKTVDEVDENILPDFARGFGYGKPTGIGVDEAPGLVPDPAWKEQTIGEPWFRGDAVNMGIGQGFMLVTPLQIANAYSAISVTGTLRNPLLIKKISDQTGAVVREFQAETVNPLPVSQGTLDAIRYGLTLVIQNPGGTAYQAWAGSSVDAAGKSGTAEDLSFGSDHTFFVAYANRSDPTVLALASLERGEAGQAAPIVRHILEAYLSGALAPSP